MSQVITKRERVSRRRFLRGLSLTGSAITVGLPPLVAMFNSTGTAYAAPSAPGPIESRYVLWFNGNGIPERYWIPAETGPRFPLDVRRAQPLAPFREDIHVLSGLDNTVGGGGHPTAMSGLMTCTHYSGRGAGGPSIDQVIASKLGSESRFRSLQIGVSQESFGLSMQRNMSWSGYERALPPEMLPDRLFDRLFGKREEGWINRKHSVLDTVREDAAELKKTLPKDATRRSVDEMLSSVRDVERAVTSLHHEYRRIRSTGIRKYTKDWPTIAKIQSDLLALCADHPADPGRFLHVDQVPGTFAQFPVAGSSRPPGITIIPMRTAKLLAPMVWRGSVSSAISAAGTCRSLLTPHQPS